ncbi:MAG: hypothetical protein ACR5KV_04425 [Wolbachia sp.]
MKLADKLKKQVKEVQELCNKLELNAKIEEKDLSKLKNIKRESEKCYKELMGYVPYSNLVMLYTAVISVGLATGLLVSTILDYTTKLSMLITIGIATAFALIAGSAIYEVLRPRTEVNESRVTYINNNSHSLP